MTDSRSQKADILSVPKNAAKELLAHGGLTQARLLPASTFARFCSERNLTVDTSRLLRLERLGIFNPIFRVRTPDDDVEVLTLPLSGTSVWFDRGWAWDTTAVPPDYAVPTADDRDTEAYYSMFQIDHLSAVLSSMTWNIATDGWIDTIEHEKTDPRSLDDKIAEDARKSAESLRFHEYRRAKALLCQFISDRYYPYTRGDERTITISTGRHFGSDRWTQTYRPDWDWHAYARAWDPKIVERIFELTPEKLKHAYRGLAAAQAHRDPVSAWHQLVQFVSLHEKERLKGDALQALTLRAGAHMLRRLHEDLYNEELPEPNEVTGYQRNPIPELEVRKDKRRYLELVVNRFNLNPQPRLALIVEGHTEQYAVERIFVEAYGNHPGDFGIEIIVLGGVDAATGGKEDRFRAILRLIDYLHHHQTITYLILDNERYARKLKQAASEAKSIHHAARHVTRADYIKVWKVSLEFDNSSNTELASALSALAGTQVFLPEEIERCRCVPNAGAALKALYAGKTGVKLDKLALCRLLVDQMLAIGCQRSLKNRPIIRPIARVRRLAARNPLPIRHETWERNQTSSHLGKKR